MARQLLFACGLLALMALSSGEHRRCNVLRWLDACVIVMAALLDAATCSWCIEPARWRYLSNVQCIARAHTPHPHLHARRG
jgi:hypothetical protein